MFPYSLEQGEGYHTQRDTHKRSTKKGVMDRIHLMDT